MKPEDKDRKKAWKLAQRAARDAALPLPWSLLNELAIELDQNLSETPCDHSTRFTQAWAERQAVDVQRLLAWSRDEGGYCDCEILANALVEDKI